jgi:hypothetical protein
VIRGYAGRGGRRRARRTEEEDLAPGVGLARLALGGRGGDLALLLRLGRLWCCRPALGVGVDLRGAPLALHRLRGRRCLHLRRGLDLWLSLGLALLVWLGLGLGLGDERRDGLVVVHPSVVAVSAVLLGHVPDVLALALTERGGLALLLRELGRVGGQLEPGRGAAHRGEQVFGRRRQEFGSKVADAGPGRVLASARDPHGAETRQAARAVARGEGRCVYWASYSLVCVLQEFNKEVALNAERIIFTVFPAKVRPGRLASCI